jgi:hypothetical protein
MWQLRRLWTSPPVSWDVPQTWMKAHSLSHKRPPYGLLIWSHSIVSQEPAASIFRAEERQPASRSTFALCCTLLVAYRCREKFRDMSDTPALGAPRVASRAVESMTVVTELAIAYRRYCSIATLLDCRHRETASRWPRKWWGGDGLPCQLRTQHEPMIKRSVAWVSPRISLS